MSSIRTLLVFIFLSIVGLARGQDYSVNTNCTTPYEDISTNATPLTLTANSISVSLPFNFNFYSSSYNQIKIDGNGAIIFINNTTNSASLPLMNSKLPTSLNTSTNLSENIGALFPHWDEFDSSIGRIDTLTKGTFPNRRFIIQWTNKTIVPPSSTPCTDCSVTFQVVLYESNGNFSFVYNDVIIGDGSTTVHPNSYGGKATIGFQKNTSEAFQYSFDQASLFQTQSGNTIAKTCLSFTKQNSFNSHTSYAVNSSIESSNVVITLTNPSTINLNNTNPTVVPLSFPFSYYDKFYNSIEINHGSVKFIENNGSSNNLTPQYLDIFVRDSSFTWDTNNGIFYETVIVNNEPIFVIDWKNVIPKVDVSLYNDTNYYRTNLSNGYNFQLHLHSNGVIKFVYTDLYADSIPLADYSYGRGAKIGFNGNYIFNDEAAIQLDDNSSDVYVLTLFKPKAYAINAPMCNTPSPTPSVQQPKTYIKYSSPITTTINLINLSTGSSSSHILNGISDSIQINQVGNYRVSTIGSVNSTTFYSNVSTSVHGYTPYLISKEFNGSSKSINILESDRPYFGISPEGVTCPTQQFTLIANTNNFIRPSYLWNIQGQITQSIQSELTPNYNVLIRENHTGCIFKLDTTIQLSGNNNLDNLIFAPISMSIDSVDLKKLLIYGEPYDLINPSNSNTYTKTFIGNHVNRNSGYFHASQVPSPGKYPITVSISDGSNGCPYIKEDSIEVLPIPELVRLDSIYCDFAGWNILTHNKTIDRDEPTFSYLENQSVGQYGPSNQRRFIFITNNEMQMTGTDGNNSENLNRTSLVNSNFKLNAGSGTLNLNDYGDSVLVTVEYYNKIILRRANNNNNSSIIDTSRYLVAKEQMWVKKGNATALITNYLAHQIDTNPIVFCEQDLNNLITVNSNRFNNSNNTRGHILVYKDNTLIDSLHPNNDKEVYFNPALIDNDNISNNYRLVYEIKDRGCEARATMYAFVPEPLDASFQHYLGNTTIPNTNNQYCNNSEPIRLEPRDATLSSSPNVDRTRSFFSIDYFAIANMTIDVTNLPNPFVPIVGNHIVTYQVTDIHGCTSSSTQQIELKPAPSPQITATYTPGKSWYCADYTNDLISLNFKPSGFTGLNASLTEIYQNTNNLYNASTFTGITSDSTIIHYTKNPNDFAPSNLDSIKYIYRVIDINGCQGSAEIWIKVYPRPDLIFNDLPSYLCQSPNIEFLLNPIPSTSTTIGATPANSNLDLSTGTPIFRPRDVVNGQILTYLHTDQYSCKTIKYDTISVTTDNTVFEWENSLPSYVCNSSSTPIQLTVRRPAYTAQPIGAPEFTTSSTLANSNPLVGQNNFNYLGTRDSISFIPNLSSNGPIVVTYSAYTQSGAGACKKYLMDTINVHRPVPLEMSFGNPHSDSICEFDTTFIFISNFPQTSLPLPPQLTTISSPNPISADGIRQNTSIYYSFIPNAIDSNNVTSALRTGPHVIKGEIFDNFGCYVSVEKTIHVKANPQPVISYLDTSYCVGTAQSVISAYPSGGNWYNITTTSTDATLRKYALTPYSIPDIRDTTALPMTSVTSQMNKIRENFGGTYLFDHIRIGSNQVIYDIKNANGCVNSDTINTIVYGIPSLSIDALPTPFVCSNEGQIMLTSQIDNRLAIPSDSVFFSDNIPSGVLFDNSLNAYVFNTMAIRPNDTLVRNITAYYKEPISGCIGRDTLPVVVRRHPDAAITNIYDGYCINGLPDTLLGANTDAATNNVTITSGIFTSTFTGVITNINSTSARIDPTQIAANSDNIAYMIQTSNGCRDTVRYHVLSYPRPSNLGIQMIDSIFCENTTNIQIQGSPSPSGVSTASQIEIFRTSNPLTPIRSISSNMLIVSPIDTPSVYSIDSYSIKYTYTDANGCTDSIRYPMTIHPKPVADFMQMNFCTDQVIRINDNSTFDTLLNSADVLDRWIWSYRGLTYADSLNNYLEVSNTTAGTARINLIAISRANCRDTISRDIRIYNNAEISFEAIGGCVGETVEFRPTITNLDPTIDTISNVVWDFGDGTTTIGSIPSINNIGVITHAYNTNGIFYPNVSVTNQSHCITTHNIRLPILPKYTPTDATPHLDDFQNSDGGWIPGLAYDGSVIWEHGIANKRNLTTTRGNNNVWITDTELPFPANAGSWIYAPCFDITQLERPMIKFDLATNLNIYDGVVLQYFNESTEQWVNLGKKDRGINWYNTESLISLLTHDSTQQYDPNHINGWSGMIGTLDSFSQTIFSNVRYRLEDLPNSDNLRFRIAFTTFNLPDNVGNREGVMFDNFFIGNRERKVLVEYISNTNEVAILPNTRHVTDLIYNQHNYKDVVLVEYHYDDDFYYQNMAPNNSRIFRYGNFLAPSSTIVNGNSIYNSATLVNQQVLDDQMLKDAKVSIEDYTMNIANGQITINGKIVAKADININSDSKFYKYTAITENYIPWNSFAGSVNQMGLLRDFVDEPSYAITTSLAIGDEIRIQDIWPLSNNTNITNLFNVNVNTFIELNDEVLQVEQVSNIDILNLPSHPILTSVELEQIQEVGKEIFSIKVFPNPATYYTNIAFDEPLLKDYQFALFDVQGRLLTQGTIPAGTQQMELNTDNYASGTYFIKLKDEHNTVSAHRKLIIIRP